MGCDSSFENSSFENIKKNIISISGQIGASIPKEFNADNSVDLDKVYQERLARVFASFAEVELAARCDDRIMLKSALIRAKTRVMSLTTFFIALEDDCITLLSECDAALVSVCRNIK